MSLFVISDLHLSTADGCNKSMEVFGRRWTGYTEKLNKAWRALVGPDDTVVIPGDISWALALQEAESDLRFIDSLPGKKYLGKGNHDFWWSTLSKMNRFLAEKGLTSLSFLHNNIAVTEEFILAGTRGWFSEEEISSAATNADFDKMIAREAIRLGISLKEAEAERAASGKEILVFTHFPPFWNDKEISPLTDLLVQYGVKRCYFGHIHGNYTAPQRLSHRGIDFMLISADYLDFVPRIISPV